MFATLAGGYPRPDLGPDATPDDLVRAVLADQEEAGLEILSDGHVRWDDRVRAILERLEGFELDGPAPIAVREPRWDGPILLDGWQAAAGATALPVKATIVGPYTLAARCAPGSVGRERLTMVLADVLSHELRALFQAGCPLVQVDEDDATQIGASRREGQLFKSAHRRLTADLEDRHLSLAVTGGSVADVPIEILFDAHYSSYLFDLITAPDNWRAVPKAPPHRGVIVGIVDARTATGAPDEAEHITWAASSAAALWERGPERVGIAPSGSLAGLTRDQARARIAFLGRVTRETVAQLEAAEAAGRALDPAALQRDGWANGWLPEDRAVTAPSGAESA